MPLPTFNASKHHFGLGGKGYLITGGYRMDPQRESSPGEFGGDTDLIGPSARARWTQDDFSGGAFNENFATDPAMISDSQNMLPSQVENSCRTVPPLVYFSAPGHIDAASALGIFSTGGKRIAVLDSDRIRTWNADTGAAIEVFDATRTMSAAAHDPTDNKLYVIVRKVSDGIPQLVSVKADYSGLDLIKEFPATAPEVARGMAVTAGRDIVAAMDKTLYSLDVNDDRDDATILRIGRLPGVWRDAVTYNGLTYILTTDGEQLTQVVAWDGTQILPVTEFPYNFLGKCIGVYGGRIYVGGSAADISGTARFAEFYEITGSSLRLVKTWSNEARASEYVNCPTQIYDLQVHEGLLWLAMDKNMLVSYDLTRDGLWNRHMIIGSDVTVSGTVERRLIVDGVPGPVRKEKWKHTYTGEALYAKFLLSTREKLVAWCAEQDGGPGSRGFYRIATSNADLTASDPDTDYVSFIETSDFVPEPDQKKRWAKLRVLTRYLPAPTLKVSQDGGDSWTAITGTSSSGNVLIFTDFDLSDLDPSEAIRYEVSFDKQSEVAYTELIAMTTSFVALDSGKYGWSFTINGADNVEQLDGTMLAQDGDELRAALRGFFQSKETLTYTDLDGNAYSVYVSALSESQPFIDAAQDAREAYFNVTLTEI